MKKIFDVDERRFRLSVNLYKICQLADDNQISFITLLASLYDPITLLPFNMT